MSLLAEEIVEEWLNRRGFFTIRGIRHGVHEIDLLAVRPVAGGKLECRHVEVQASTRPIGYVASVSVPDPRGTSRSRPTAKRRTPEAMCAAVRTWVDKKFHSQSKQDVRSKLAPGPWTLELVVHNVRYEDEIRCIEAERVLVHRLSDIVGDLVRGDDCKITSAAGSALIELVALELGANSSALRS